MKNEEYLIETAIDSTEQTLKNGIAYYDAAIMLLEKYNQYNFFVNEDLESQNLIEKYTAMNVILTNFAFAYENMMKYLLLKNHIINNPNIKKEELWGRWIYKHGISQLYDLATSEENHNIHNFCDSFLKIINISKKASEFKLLADKSLKGNLINLNYFENDSILLRYEVETWNNFPNEITNEKLLDFVIENDELFVSCRYSGQNKTNYNFLNIYYFIKGVYDYTNIIHNNNGIVPENIKREYVKYKINTPKIKSIIMKYYSEEEINKIEKIIKDDSVLVRILLGPESYGLKYYSFNDIESLIKSDETFQDEHYLFLAVLLGLTKDDIINHKNQGKNIKKFIDNLNDQDNINYEENETKDRIIKI